MKSKIVFSLFLGTLFSVITLYFAFKNVPFAELIQYLASVNYFWIIPSIMAIVLAFVLRVIRWQILLGASKPVSFWEAFHPLMIGFMANCSPKRIYTCLVYSAFIWTLSGYSYYLLAKGSPGLDLSIFEITAVMVLVCFAIALPSAPGYWGLWEAGGVFALSLFGVNQKAALGFTLINHAINIFPIIIIGLISAWITGVNLRRLPKKKIIEN